MNDLVILKIILSFFIAGSWIAAATFLAEKFGSKIGGLLTNLPSNILISLIFLTLINGMQFALSTIPAVPIGMTINTLFLLVFIFFLRYGVIKAVIISLIFWFVLALVILNNNFPSLIFNTLGYFTITLLVIAILERGLKIPSAEKSAKNYTKLQLLIRAVFAGGIVSSVIIISKFFDPFMVGIVSTFPAVILSTMVILVINQGIRFAQATGKILVLSSSNIIIYVIVVNMTYPKFGMVIGTIISFICACFWVALFHPIVKRLN